MPPNTLQPTPEELEELRLRRRASQLKGYGAGPGLRPLQEASDVARGLFGAEAIIPGGEGYRTGQALANMPAVGVAALPAKAAAALPDVAAGLGALGVIKPKGGNWLVGSVERGLSKLKPQGPAHRDEALILGGPWARDADTPQGQAVIKQNAALSDWIDSKLNKYVRNEMATPEDPVRALAERGVLHRAPYELADPNSALMNKRLKSGMPVKPMGQSQEAQFWESVTDRAIDPARAADFKYGSLDESILQNNPWLEKVPDEAMVYSAKGLSNDLGFNHLIDELRNATNPDSGLPRSLQLSPDKLQKVTVPQAVELVDKINKWRAEQKVAADLKRSQNAATAEYKTYETVPGTTEPNQRGLRWVELRTPEITSADQLTPEAKAKYQWYLTTGVGEEAALRQAAKHDESLAESLKYEGEVMGHCVGGYCPDVEEGRSRIYSLRDAKGEPHVTIEVRPGIIEPRMNGDVKLPDEIVQIKGKANRAPKDEYLPFVQDFVRSGQWSSVGDLGNTGMRSARDVFSEGELNMLRQAGQDVPPALSGEDIQRLHNLIVPEGRRLKYNARGQVIGSEDPNYAAGGAVHLKKGGAVTDPNEPEVKRLPEPGLLTATMYAETAAREMYPKDPVKRDAARHMIASSILGQKLSPGTSRLLGELYEFKTSPLLHLKSAVGLGTPPPGYEMDKFNNALGSEMQFRNQAELQRGVRQAVDTGRARLTPDEPAPYRRGGAVKIETNPTLMADELLFKGYRR